MNKIKKPCACAMCHMPMMVGEEFEWVEKTHTRHAFNSGRPFSRKIVRPRHPLSVGCMGPGWRELGGGYDRHIASVRQ